jgi:GNAT superfamily N-acetyltransferase
VATADVRPAVAADVESLALLQLSWWRAAYATVLPAVVLGVDPAVLAASWRDRVAAGTVVLATEGDEVVGFAAIDPAIAGKGVSAVGSIDVVGVLPRWSRRGHGGRLIATVAQMLRDRGAVIGSWWVPEADPSVTAFLFGVGWSPAGERRELDTGEGSLVEVRYSGSLDLVLI